MVSDLTCIFASVCFAYQPIFELCNILLSLPLLLLKDVDMNYSNTVSNTARKPKKTKTSGKVWSETHDLFFWCYPNIFSLDIKKYEQLLFFWIRVEFKRCKTTKIQRICT